MDISSQLRDAIDEHLDAAPVGEHIIMLGMRSGGAGGFHSPDFYGTYLRAYDLEDCPVFISYEAIDVVCLMTAEEYRSTRGGSFSEVEAAIEKAIDEQMAEEDAAREAVGDALTDLLAACSASGSAKIRAAVNAYVEADERLEAIIRGESAEDTDEEEPQGGTNGGAVH